MQSEQLFGDARAAMATVASFLALRPYSEAEPPRSRTGSPHGARRDGADGGGAADGAGAATAVVAAAAAPELTEAERVQAEMFDCDWSEPRVLPEREPTQRARRKRRRPDAPARGSLSPDGSRT